jgi:fatty-acid desaturase
MMTAVERVNDAGANPVSGDVRIDWLKAIWNGLMISAAAILCPLFFSLSAILLFCILTWLSLLLGHSIGMHRMMIHRSFSAKPWLEKTLIYIGVLVGMGGPSRVISIHDMRDWAQRQPAAHDFFTHKRSYWRDIGWQLFARFKFENPPQLVVEDHFAKDRFFCFLDKSWRWHQLPLAVLLYFAGGWPWVVWGIFGRIAASVIGHWTITYFCHNPGPGKWRVNGACVQASDLPGLGWLTFGECWHNNHHAFPESARIGLEKRQSDPAAWVIERFEKLGWVYDVGRPRPENAREDLSLNDHGTSTVSIASASIAG